nr:hypothetical protein [Nitrogeniibacter aestuarii]
MLHLKVHPKLRSIAKPMSKPERRVAGYSVLAVDDLGNAAGGDEKLAGKFSGSYSEGRQPAGQYLAWMNGDAQILTLCWRGSIRLFVLSRNRESKPPDGVRQLE